MSVSSFWAPAGWVEDAHASDVVIEVVDGVIRTVSSGRPAPPGAVELPGVVVPGMVDAHSHVFHRALRGHPDVGGDFWDWRTVMYHLAERLDPESFERLATATFAEMAATGVTLVGEFHYLHHGPGGVPYEDRHEMSMALVRAAATAGIRLCLLDTCYLMAGVEGTPLGGPQLRFGDGDWQGWVDRHMDLSARLAGSDVVLGSAIHSIRAVPVEAFEPVTATPGPTHVHVSEQPAENAACQQVHGISPVRLLSRHGGLGSRTTLVHAIHVDDADLAIAAEAGSSVCVCPTTEMDLGDGTADVARMLGHGIDVSLGSDSHAVIDLITEARLVEWNDRARYGRRGIHRPAALWRMATAAGAASLGFPSWGLIPGAPADFAVVGLDRIATAGTVDAGAILSAATGADVIATFVAGREIVRSGEHRTLGAVGAVLAEVIEEVAL